MQTQIDNAFLQTENGILADSILRNCVHCGFCTATCPTYQVTGDELDGPRGRIYLIKQMLEAQTVTKKTMHHLDRCLTCRSCETTCPSGVKYSQLLEIGRKEIERRVKRPLHQKLFRKLLLNVLPYPERFGFFLSIGQFFRPVLPAGLKRKIPARTVPSNDVLPAQTRKFLVLEGCVQPVMSPGINAASKRVLNRLGIELIPFHGCCGAINQHMSDEQRSHEIIKNNIDRLTEYFQDDIEGIVVTASGCGATLKDYPDILHDDNEYLEKAKIVRQKTVDLTEVIDSKQLITLLKKPENIQKVAVHTPCTLQHAQKLPDTLENILSECGYHLAQINNKYLCCGSAGTYSLTQPALSDKVRQQRLAGLTTDNPDIIVTANIGCLHHLNEESPVPVIHWIEFIDEHLIPA